MKRNRLRVPTGRRPAEQHTEPAGKDQRIIKLRARKRGAFFYDELAAPLICGIFVYKHFAGRQLEATAPGCVIEIRLSRSMFQGATGSVLAKPPASDLPHDVWTCQTYSGAYQTILKPLGRALEDLIPEAYPGSRTSYIVHYSINLVDGSL